MNDPAKLESDHIFKLEESIYRTVSLEGKRGSRKIEINSLMKLTLMDYMSNLEATPSYQKHPSLSITLGQIGELNRPREVEILWDNAYLFP